ncbi:MAG: SPOR domain-containing protein [Desulfobacterales bacterium]|jgi:hypothetical protein
MFLNLQMNRKLKILFALLIPGLIFLIFSIIYAENGLIDLVRLRDEKNFLISENSRIGLKLFDDIDIFKRLAKNDLKLIDRLARKHGMVGKDELVLIPLEPIKELKEGKPKTQVADNFRILTDEEFDELLNFDIESFKFYEELKENDEELGTGEKQPEQNIKNTEEEKSAKQNGKNTGSPKIENAPQSDNADEKDKISGALKTITIQIAAFRDRKHAEELLKKLNQKGYQAFIVSGKSNGDSEWHRVRIGHLKNENEARAIISRLKQDKFNPIILNK